MNTKVLGFCGVDCGICPIYTATLASSIEKRNEVAKMLFDNYGVKFEAEHINCTGCYKATMEETAIMGHCKNCELRICAKEKKIGTCADCIEYACSKLESKWSSIPNGAEARENLEKI